MDQYCNIDGINWAVSDGQGVYYDLYLYFPNCSYTIEFLDADFHMLKDRVEGNFSSEASKNFINILREIDVLNWPIADYTNELNIVPQLSYSFIDDEWEDISYMTYGPEEGSENKFKRLHQACEDLIHHQLGPV